MLSKNEVKYIQSLHHKKQRNAEGVFIVEGKKLVTEVLESNYEVVSLYALPEYSNTLSSKSTVVVEVDEFQLEKISALKTPSKVLAIVKQKPLKLPNFHNTFSLLLDDIQDPGNFGTIIRIADWFGVKNILCTNNTVDVYNTKVLQSTMGSFTRVNVWYGNVIEEVLTKTTLPVFGAILNGQRIANVKKQQEGLLIIGNEGNGISKEILNYVTVGITIPRIGGAESLNAAVATGIIISHII